MRYLGGSGGKSKISRGELAQKLFSDQELLKKIMTLDSKTITGVLDQMREGKPTPIGPGGIAINEQGTTVASNPPIEVQTARALAEAKARVSQGLRTTGQFEPEDLNAGQVESIFAETLQKSVDFKNTTASERVRSGLAEDLGVDVGVINRALDGYKTTLTFNPITGNQVLSLVDKLTGRQFTTDEQTGLLVEGPQLPIGTNLEGSEAIGRAEPKLPSAIAPEVPSAGDFGGPIASGGPTTVGDSIPDELKSQLPVSTPETKTSIGIRAAKGQTPVASVANLVNEVFSGIKPNVLNEEVSQAKSAANALNVSIVNYNRLSGYEGRVSNVQDERTLKQGAQSGIFNTPFNLLNNLSTLREVIERRSAEDLRFIRDRTTPKKINNAALASFKAGRILLGTIGTEADLKAAAVNFKKQNTLADPALLKKQWDILWGDVVEAGTSLSKGITTGDSLSLVRFKLRALRGDVPTADEINEALSLAEKKQYLEFLKGAEQK